MARTTSIAAVDLGASSGRVMVGSVTSDDLRLAEVQRFDNVPVRVNVPRDRVGSFEPVLGGDRGQEVTEAFQQAIGN